MCEFCKEELNAREIIINDEDDKMFFNFFDKLEVGVVWGDTNYANFSINYCPMCGRSL